MRPLLAGLAAISFTGLFAVSSEARDAPRPTTDLIAYGRIDKNLTAEALDDFGMNGRMTARFRISRVVRGRPASSVVTIQYIAHTYLVENHRLRLRMRRSNDGAYLVCANGSGIGYICR